MSLYSVRFILAAGNGVTLSYAVPSGRRAVVRNITSVNRSSVLATFYVNVAGVNIFAIPVPVSDQRFEGNLRAVAYGGERIETFVSAAAGHPETHIGVFGYLFDDTLLARAPDVEVIPGPPAWLEAELE